jgi:hypothetical protein
MTFIKRFWEDVYPGRSAKLLWDNNNMRITNFDDQSVCKKEIIVKDGIT